MNRVNLLKISGKIFISKLSFTHSMVESFTLSNSHRKTIGILRMACVEGCREITGGLGGPGSSMLPPHSFYMSRERLYKVMQSPQEFAMWMFDIAICQMSGSEMKLSLRIFSSG